MKLALIDRKLLFNVFVNGKNENGFAHERLAVRTEELVQLSVVPVREREGELSCEGCSACATGPCAWYFAEGALLS